MKASQQEFLATCIDVDLEKNVKHAQQEGKWKGTTMWTTRIRNNQRSPVHCSVLCIVKFPIPINHTFLGWPFLTDFKKYTHTPPPPPPPQGNDVLAHWTKNSKTPGKMPKSTESAHNESSQEIYAHTCTYIYMRYVHLHNCWGAAVKGEACGCRHFGCEGAGILGVRAPRGRNSTCEQRDN